MFHIQFSLTHWIDESTSLSPQAHQRPSGWQSRNLSRTLSSAVQPRPWTDQSFFSGNHFWSPIHEQESRGNRGNSIRDNPYSRSKSVADSSLLAVFDSFRNIADDGKGAGLQKQIAGLVDQPPTRYDSALIFEHTSDGSWTCSWGLNTPCQCVAEDWFCSEPHRHANRILWKVVPGMHVF